MSVWLVMPSKRPPEERDPILKLWKERGYKVALWLDGPPFIVNQLLINYWNGATIYHGYAQAVNQLALEVLDQDPDAQWIVAAGDDTEPDANHSAEEIAAQCSKHFAELHAGPDAAPGVDLSVKSIRAALNGVAMATFGCMQPTADRWGDHHYGKGAYIDRVAGSPWLGREFCLRVNQGNGPLWPEYFHMFADQELQAVATRLGVFWQRPDLTHMHKHWGRAREGERMAPRSRMPQFLERANSAEEWEKGKRLFADRQAAGFPGSEPL
jgi:hypothetical protein